MLKRTHRFHGYGSLKAVYNRGTSVRLGMITARCAQRNNDKPFRVAIVVSKKVSKSAVARNRIRRRLYEAIRMQGGLTPGSDLVVTVFSDRLETMPASQIESMVSEMLKKVAVQIAGAV